MPIEVITGQPGNGKTLLMMERLLEAAQKAERPIWAAGIDGLTPGLAEVLPNPRDWNAILPGVEGTCECNERPPHAHLVPNGSLIFVDEAWKWFGHLHDARQAPTPQHVLALAEHRHRGLDFVMTTQMTNQLYPFMRGLIGGHTHVVRRFGLQLCDLYTWGELCDDVASTSKREAALKNTWRYPKALFSKYTSATQHTIKRKIPWKVWLLPIALAGSLFAAWRLYAWAQHQRHQDRQTATTTEAGAGEAGAAPAGADGDKKHVMTTGEYITAHTPRLAAQPWSAPIYDGRPVTTDPRLYCMISGTGAASTCHCYTEQATPYRERLTSQQCRLFAKEGVYNPYQVQVQEQQSMPSFDRPREQGPLRDHHASGGGGKFGAPPAYGVIFSDKPDPEPTNTFSFGSSN